MLHFISMIQNVHPGIFVHSVHIDEDLDKDKNAGFVRDFLIFAHDLLIVVCQYGNVNEQIELVSAQISSIKELQGGFDAIGLSQGISLIFYWGLDHTLIHLRGRWPVPSCLRRTL